MAGSSELARLYVGAFGKQPSAASLALLIRMEEFCGLSQDDPLSRMLVLQLRVADHHTEIQKESAAEFKGIVAELRDVLRESRSSIARISSTRFSADHYYNNTDAKSKPLRINHFRKVSPIFSFLRKSFRLRNGVLDEDELTMAARGDFARVVGAALLIFFCGMALGRLH